MRCALDLNEEATDEDIKMMLVMGDIDKVDEFGEKYKNNGVNREDFLRLMRELGLNPDKNLDKTKQEPGFNPDDPYGHGVSNKHGHHHHHHHHHHGGGGGHNHH